MRGLILQKDITILNMYIYQTTEQKNILAETDRTTRKIDKSIIITEDFNTTLSVIDRISSQIISKEILN